MTDTRNPETIAWYLKMLGETEQTALYIPAIFLKDELLENPKQWILNVLAKFGKGGTQNAV